MIHLYLFSCILQGKVVAVIRCRLKRNTGVQKALWYPLGFYFFCRGAGCLLLRLSSKKGSWGGCRACPPLVDGASLSGYTYSYI